MKAHLFIHNLQAQSCQLIPITIDEGHNRHRSEHLYCNQKVDNKNRSHGQSRAFLTVTAIKNQYRWNQKFQRIDKTLRDHIHGGQRFPPNKKLVAVNHT
ncbi:hypothetical protein DJ031_00515 [bacterium endosymbiont of Escarpia laminata]|nr:MAG: hypothetical protein DJ031_00515 [bacterium endosymbiont of Escarpia laminata]